MLRNQGRNSTQVSLNKYANSYNEQRRQRNVNLVKRDKVNLAKPSYADVAKPSYADVVKQSKQARH